MNDEETVALIVGGHTCRQVPRCRRPAVPRPGARGLPGGAPGPRLEEHATAAAWASTRSPAGSRAPGPTSRRRGTTATSTTCSSYDWELTTSPAGAQQWTPKDPEAQGTVPDAHDPSRRHAPMMLTSDLALRVDPIYEPIAKRFHENPDELADAFAKAWYKLLHRDMGPLSRYLGPWVPGAAAVAGPRPGGRPRPGRRRGRRRAQGARSSAPACRSPSWSPPPGRRRRASAAPTSAAGPTGRGSASRRSATGRSTTRPSWPSVLAALEQIQQDFNGSQSGGTKISLADLIVLGGCAAVEKAAQERRARRHRPVRTGTHRRLAGADRRRVVRRARAEGRRVPQLPPGRREAAAGDPAAGPRVHADADRAGDDGAGRRPAGARTPTSGRPRTASSPTAPGTLTNDFFVNLLDMGTEWKPSGPPRTSTTAVTARPARSPGRRPPSTSSSARTRSSAPSRRSTRPTTRSEKFVRDFVAAWDKVMNLDRFDLA